MQNMEQRTIPVEAAAKILGIGRATAYRAALKGEIPAIRIGNRLLVVKDAFDRMFDVSPKPAPEKQTAVAL